MSILKYYKQLLCGMVGVVMLALPAFATNITVNQAFTIDVGQDIGTVFISQPQIADYKVVNKQRLLVFAKHVGQTQLVIYDVDGGVIQSRKLFVDEDLTLVRRQLAKFFPDEDITVESVGRIVTVTGLVDSEKVRDDAYRMIAMLLEREAVPRFATMTKDTGIGWSEFAEQYQWDGIVEGLSVLGSKQVNVKVSVAQVTEEFTEAIGVQWATIGQGFGRFLLQEFKAADLVTLITALGDDSMAEVLAEPNLTVMSGESADFLVGGELPIIVHDKNGITISFKEYGVRLGITAKVQSNDRIRLNLSPEVSSIERYIEAQGIQVPQLFSRKANTTIELADGQSFILGGLLDSTDLEQLSKVPLLGDVPVFGAAFRYASTVRRKTELLIVATVNLVEPTQTENVRLPNMQRSSTLGRLLNVDLDQDEDLQEQQAMEQMLQKGGFIQ
ncbi:type II and III secretion system protein family protein [Aliagarivorans taiwanensis]|uniref:type II and III secretion system protein family protein n=1 Tax=Aliagarivorans taiwanensis TaxID=561966 RepID=UPI000402781C|nr:pilus assembly protein N-terminal domain-containing protein [Aliagarivorans taiwanensis]